jgi:glycosyltransferase involved in cell wall biosynthesis
MTQNTSSPPDIKHVMIIGSHLDGVYTARGPLIRAMIARGFKVTVVTQRGSVEREETLKGWGADFQAVEYHQAALSPVSDLAYFNDLRRVIQRLRPDAVLSFTAKAVIYGTLAAALTRTRRKIVMITGLGYALTEGREWKRRLSRAVVLNLYRLVFKLADAVILQNRDDADFFEGLQVRGRQPFQFVSGGGVDLEMFRRQPLPKGAPTAVMISRLVADKGVREYAAAAAMVRGVIPDAKFLLIGELHPNPTAVSAEELEAWRQTQTLEYLGAQNDVRPYLAAAHLFVLPSYREGTPVAALEALATGRAIVTTDVPGCRETVRDGGNGLLVPPRDAKALAEAICTLMQDLPRAGAMASRSHQLAVDRFDSKIVAAKTIAIITG